MSELANAVLRSVGDPQRNAFEVTPELEAWLLEADDKSATPLSKADFDGIRERVRTRSQTDGFLASQTPPGSSLDTDWQETPELVAELERRLADYTANPAIAVPFEPGYFENLKRQLADERAQKASTR